MSSHTYLKLAMKRLASMQKQAMSEISVVSDAAHYYPYVSGVFPYWYNVLGPMDEGDIADDIGMDLKSIFWTVNAVMVIAHITAGYKGEKAEDAYDYASQWIDFFINHRGLTSTEYPDPLDYLFTPLVRIASSSGLVALQNTGTEQQQAGIRFTITLPFIRQAY